MAVSKNLELKSSEARAVISIDVPAEDLKARQQIELEKFRKTFKMPGFREGKVPVEMIGKKFGEYLTGKAAEHLIATAYFETVKEHGLQPYKDPSFSDFTPDTAQGFKTTATVELFPSVELGACEKLQVARDTVKAGDEDLEHELNRLRESFAELVSRDDGIREGDIVLMDLKGFGKDGNELPDAAMPAYRVEIKKGNVPEDLLKGVKGMHAGEEKEITVKYPQDFPAGKLAGQKILFRVKISEVKEKRLPALDDAFASEVDPKFKTFSELKDDIRKHIKEAAIRREESLFDSRILTALGEASRYAIPDSFLEEKAEENIADFFARLNRENVTPGIFYERQKITPEKMKEDVKKRVLQKTKEELTWLEVAKKENIKVEQTDMDAEVEALCARYSITPEQARDHLKKTDRERDMATDILRRKVMAHLRRTVSEKKGRSLKFADAVAEE